MAKEDLSKAELYRQERKERLAKESKKNAKMNAKVAKIKRVAIKAVAIVVALAIVCSIAVIVINSTGSTLLKTTAFKVGDYDVSSSEFQYYYHQIYNNYATTAQNYDSQYGPGTAMSQLQFDYTKSPDEQAFPKSEETSTEPAGENTTGNASEEPTTEKPKEYDTWNDFFVDYTYTFIQSNVSLAMEAEKAKVSLDEKEIKAVEDEIENLRKSVGENNFTLGAYLKTAYGRGINENIMKKFMLRDALAKKYGEAKQDELMASFSAEEIEEEYKKNLTTYSFADLRLYQAKVETPTLKDDATEKEKADAQKKAVSDAKKKAEDFFKVAIDEKAFIAEANRINKAENQIKTNEETDITLQKLIDFSSLKSNISEDAANWAFDSARKIGDTKVFASGQEDNITAYYVAFMSKPAYKDASHRLSVRHILYKFGEEATAEENAKKKTDAEDLLKEWKAGEATEESFAVFAETRSEDEGSATNGGLYENVSPGQMVKAFNDWCFDKNRKKGDTGIVETEYGYHIMYYVGNDEYPFWEKQVRGQLSGASYEDYVKALVDGDAYKVEKNEGFFFNRINNSIIKTIKRGIFNLKSSQATNQAAYQ